MGVSILSYTCIYVHTYIHTYNTYNTYNTYIYTYIYTYICTYIQYIHIRTYIHAYIHVFSWLCLSALPLINRFKIRVPCLASQVGLSSPHSPPFSFNPSFQCPFTHFLSCLRISVLSHLVLLS